MCIHNLFRTTVQRLCQSSKSVPRVGCGSCALNLQGSLFDTDSIGQIREMRPEVLQVTSDEVLCGSISKRLPCRAEDEANFWRHEATSLLSVQAKSALF